MNRIGIDLGGTKIEGIVLDDNLKEIIRKRIETEQGKGYKHILERIKDLYQELCTETQSKRPTLGIGTPGAISNRTGLLKNSNTICLNEKPFQADLEACLKRKVVIQNDANCFALAESIRGAAKGKSWVFGVIMGTGCGGGIVHEGKVIQGFQHIAGEWGHMVLDPKGPECYCGRRGCVETLISGGGLEKRFEKQEGQQAALKDIVEKSRKGDSVAQKFTDKFLEDFGRSLGNLINVLDPEMIVLGGGVSNINELYEEGIQRVRKYVFSDSLETEIVKNQLGDSAGVIGAALIGE